MADDRASSASDWAKHKPLHDAVLAEARHGREWPFAIGDQVCVRDSPSCDLRVYAGSNPDAVLTVHEVSDGGRWLSLRDQDGRVHRGYGPTYFRIAGECGDHFPGYRSSGRPGRTQGGYVCLRCDEPMTEITRILLGDLQESGPADG